MALRFEAWTLPWSTTFQRKIADLPAVAGQSQGTIRFNDYGEATIALPADYDRLDEVISATEGSLIRVYDGTTIVQEFLAERVERNVEDTNLVFVSGPGLESAFDRAIVYPFDYPESPSTFPDHIWAGQEILGNPGFEEDGSTPEIVEVWTDATGGTFTLTDGTDTTDPIAYDAAAATVENELTSAFASITDCDVSGEGTETSPWRIEFINPKIPDYTLSGSGASLTGEDEGLVIEVVQNGVLTPAVWEKSQGADRRSNPHLHGRYASNGFELATDIVRTGTYSLRVNGLSQFAGAQQVVRVTPGGTYTASIWARTTDESATYRLVLRDIYEGLIATTAETSMTANTWTEFTLENVEIPAGVELVVFRFAVTSVGNPLPYWIDDASLKEGQPPATVGEILTSLLDDATTDHSGDTRGTILDWVDYSGFDATNDSSSTAWSDELAFTAYRGMTYGQVFDRFVELGYEWNLTPKATPTAGLTHDLNWYQSGNLGSDHTSGGPAITVGQAVTGGPVVSRIPAYTAVLVEGSDGQFSEDSDSTAASNFGRLERYDEDSALANSTALTSRSTELLAAEERNRVAVQVNVVASPNHYRPLVDYVPGDTMYFQVPPALARTSRRVRQISWRHEEPTSYQVTGSRVFDAESGAWEAIRKLIRRFEPRRESGNGGPVLLGRTIIPWLVAASDTPDGIRDVAAFQCLGENDEEKIQQCLDAFGVAWLAPGAFNVTVGSDADSTAVLMPNQSHIVGLNFLHSGIGPSEFSPVEIYLWNSSGTAARRSGFSMTSGEMISNVHIQAESNIMCVRGGGSGPGAVDHCNLYSASGVALWVDAGTGLFRVTNSSITAPQNTAVFSQTDELLLTDNRIRARDYAVYLSAPVA